MTSSAGGPVRTWKRAAVVLGISLDTLDRKRRKFGDTTVYPWWPDEDAVKAWFAALIAPKPVAAAKPSRPRRARTSDEPLDVAALRRSIR